MYQNHFKLERRIFRGNAAGPDVFVGPQTTSILTGIKKALAGPDAVVTLTGPVGSGKSTTVAHSLGAISGKNAIVRVGRFPLQRGELLDLLFDHMRIQQRPQRGNQKLALFRQLLFNLAQNDSRMFILVEDAPFLGPDLLAELEVVSAADTGPSDGAAIVLMGDDHLSELLASKPLARLRQRVRLRRSLEPCSIEELGGYLRHCFRQAGGNFDKIFAPGAAELLHQLSGGILRVVNNLVEASLEAAADANSASVDLDLTGRIAEDEFGLTGTFTQLPEIGSKQPEPRHSDDATAELVALSMPEPEAAAPELADAAAPAAAPEVVDAEDDIPDLIQDTQPSLAILNDVPEPPEPEPQRHAELTLPDIEAISAELGADPLVPAAPTPEPEAARQPKAPPKPKTAARPQTAPKYEAPARPKAGSRPGNSTKPATATEPVGNTKAGQAINGQPAARPEPASAAPAKTPETPAPAPEFKLELEEDAAPKSDDTIPTLSGATDIIESPAKSTTDDDKPDWDRDPTLAELRPDLDALERAMAVAQGRETETVAEPAPVPAPKQAEKEEIEEIPEITLDDSINRKVDKAALERQKRLENEGIVEEQQDDKADAAAEDKAREEQSTAELEKIAAGLARAKTIEDVDDKMAETLFGEELSVAAAAVAARVAEEAAAAVAEESRAADKPAAASKSEMEKEFENVWGETPGIEVSIDSENDDQKGGLDMSASQRLATVRALNTGNPETGSPKASAAPAAPVASPDPIEDQITTSLTQTMKALKVPADPAAINDDDDGRKGGFFSRFRRS